MTLVTLDNGYTVVQIHGRQCLTVTERFAAIEGPTVWSDLWIAPGDQPKGRYMAELVLAARDAGYRVGFGDFICRRLWAYWSLGWEPGAIEYGEGWLIPCHRSDLWAEPLWQIVSKDGRFRLIDPVPAP